MGSAEANLGDIFEDKKRIKNPLVPIGALMTAGVLTAGLISFRRGNSQLSQKLMRARVIVQGGTVALMIGSAYYYGEETFKFAKKSTKEALDSIEKAVEHSLASTGLATRGF